MELRHLRYFVAVAEAGSLTVAAEQSLHTAQPSLSRQIRDLELEVGAQLLTRSARGVALTAAGRAFLDHARLALAQVEAAKEAARRAAGPEKRTFAVGFLSGHELDWLPEAMRILKDELPSIEVTISSDHSPALADALLEGQARRGLSQAGTRHPRLGLQAPAIGASAGRDAERSPPRVAGGGRRAGSGRGGVSRDVGHGTGAALGHRRLSAAVRRSI